MYVSSYTIASLGLHTGVRCAERQMRKGADWIHDGSDRTTRLIMIENVDDCWDVVARADV
jgi:hypothetical protein